jgi:mono/diheme cytochrome c family protein
MCVVSSLGRILIGVGLSSLVLVACVPWRDYPVSPAFEGRVTGSQTEGATLRLEVQNQSSSSLGAHRVVGFDANGRFRIEPIALRLGGREIFKMYAAFLRFEGVDGSSRIIWRGEWDRGFFDRRVLLECELSRPTDFGQPCRVVDPVKHRWLVTAGQLEFLESCTSCHDVGATGGGPAAPGLKTPPPDLTRIAARRGGRFDRDEIQSWIDGRRRAAAHGTGEMPIWGLRMPYEPGQGPDSEDLTAARIDAIVTYLESLQRPAEAAPDAD